MIITCPRCKHVGPAVIKMGGLLCASCRVIVHDNASKDWRKAVGARAAAMMAIPVEVVNGKLKTK